MCLIPLSSSELFDKSRLWRAVFEFEVTASASFCEYSLKTTITAIRNVNLTSYLNWTKFNKYRSYAKIVAILKFFSLHSN